MRFLPRPWLSTALLATWLMLAGDLSGRSVAGGALIALLLPPLLARLWPPDAGPRHPLAALGLVTTFLLDVVVANLQVARLVLFRRESGIRPQFIEVPLDLEDRWGITVLASIITMTPGTISVAVSPDQRVLLVHALDVDDAAAVVAAIKARYEAPLRRIFPGKSRP